jgi:hypothetical protein
MQMPGSMDGLAFARWFASECLPSKFFSPGTRRFPKDQRRGGFSQKPYTMRQLDQPRLARWLDGRNCFSRSVTRLWEAAASKRIDPVSPKEDAHRPLQATDHVRLAFGLGHWSGLKGGTQDVFSQRVHGRGRGSAGGPGNGLA